MLEAGTPPPRTVCTDSLELLVGDATKPVLAPVTNPRPLANLRRGIVQSEFSIIEDVFQLFFEHTDLIVSKQLIYKYSDRIPASPAALCCRHFPSVATFSNHEIEVLFVRVGILRSGQNGALSFSKSEAIEGGGGGERKGEREREDRRGGSKTNRDRT